MSCVFFLGHEEQEEDTSFKSLEEREDILEFKKEY